MQKDIFVIKRSGEKEKFSQQKINRILKWACDGVESDPKVIADQFEFNYTSDGISTKEIHKSLIEASLDLISEENPDYQLVAGRLLNYSLRKNVWGGINPPRLIDLIKSNTKLGYYDKLLLEKYSTKDINKINETIDHGRDLNLTHGGIKQLIDKYLVQDRKSGEIYETPQFAYVLVAMTLFAEEKENRLQWVKKAYDYFSTFKINLATPVIAGARTPLRSFASCALFAVGDSLDSIGATDYLLKKASASRYGLGLDISRMRPLGAPIRHGDVLHTGLVPYLKSFESGIKSCHQNGIRGASATVFINWWHQQVEDVLVLKNNALPDERAVRFLDYCLIFSELLTERVKKKESITLFNPNEVPELTENFGLVGWDEMYLKREQDTTISKKVISSLDLMTSYAKERLGTGRVYSMHIENVNRYTPFKERVGQSNLCLEVLHPTIASNKWNDESALIGVCILAGVNALHTTNEEFESVCEVTVRMLDNLISYQSYFDVAAKNFATKYRSLAIGTLNFAALLASKGISYNSPEAAKAAGTFAEKLSYFTIKASIKLAKERGGFDYFKKTKWADGELPIDRYCKKVDEFIDPPVQDWEALRELLKQYGIRHSTLTAFMPVESTSAISSSTSALEPIRSYIVSKTSKAGKIVSIAPNLKRDKDSYSLAFDLPIEAMQKVYAAVNKFTCMSISANSYVNVAHYENKQVPLSVVVRDTLNYFDLGGKTQYYFNTEDNSGEESGCAGGACSL